VDLRPARVPIAGRRLEVEHAVDAIRRWGEERDWRGYDPYDALNSPFSRYLTLGTPFGERALTQIVKRSPINLRPLLRVERGYDAKALGLVASGYVRLAVARGDEAAEQAARRWLERLVVTAVADGSGRAWGYHFPVRTRFFAYGRGTPNTIATSFVAHAFLDGLEFLGQSRFGDTARAASLFLLEHMHDKARHFFRYLPEEEELVHNANLLACSVVVRTASLLGEALDSRVEEAVATSASAQRSDGSWAYAASSSGSWVDNFHTGYVLESLGRCTTLVSGLESALAIGFDYWERELFESDGTPRPRPDRRFPRDAHDYAQAIDTWLSAASWREGAIPRAEKTAELLVRDLLNPRGYVDFQRGRVLTNRVPFIRWTTAPTFRALAGLELVTR
jgi:hypothetical protein